MSNTFLRALDHGGGFEGALRKEALRRFEAIRKLVDAAWTLQDCGNLPDAIRALIEAEWLPTGARTLAPVAWQIEVPLPGGSTQTIVREPG